MRASIAPSIIDKFVRWYEQEHLPQRHGHPRAPHLRAAAAGVNWTALYELADDAAVHLAIASNEADKARRMGALVLTFRI